MRTLWKMSAASSARPVRASWSLGSLIFSFVLMFGSTMGTPVAWLGVATLAVAPSMVHAQAEPPCDPADAGANDNDGDENCVSPTVGKNLGSPKKPECNCTYPQGSSGDPIDNATGNIYVDEDDLQGSGAFPLRLTRSYNSSTISMMYMSAMSTSTSALVKNGHPLDDDSASSRSEIESVVYPLAGSTSTSGVANYVYPFGVGWSFSLGARLLLDNAQPLASLEALRGDGQVLTFALANGVWSTDADINDHLTTQVSGAGAITGWILTDANLNVEQYDATGHLLSLTNHAGMTQTFTYSTASTPSSVAPTPGLLISATDVGGRTVQFTYNTQSRVNAVTDSVGGHYAYAYDSNGNLTSVTYPDTSVRHYTYAYSGLSSLYLLTSVVDETNTTYANYTYDASYQVGTSSSLAGGVNAVHLVLGATGNNTSQATDALGAMRRYFSQFLVNGFRNTQVQTPCLGCATSVNTTTYTYNANGYVASETNALGDGSTPRNLAYTWDTAHNLLLSFVDGSGSSDQRTTNTTWNPTLRVPLTRTVLDTSNHTVASSAWAYNSRAQVTAQCEMDPTVSGATSYSCGSAANAPAGVRQQRTTYCDAVDATQCPLIGLPLSVDGPRTDVSDMTTFTYYLVDSASAKHGDLKSVTNALGQTTTILNYDDAGRVLSQQDANGVITTFTYTARGWLHTRSVAGATTTIVYTPYGAVASVTDPDNVTMTYGYDAAHRLTTITDAQGNVIHYTLDAAGNKTAEQIHTTSGTGTVVHSLSRAFNSLGQLTKVTDGLNHTVFGATAAGNYDGNGNLVRSSDALGIQHQQSFDALNRLVSTIDNYNGADTATQNTTTTLAYDALDRLEGINDPDNLVTINDFDGLGNRTALHSPDTGGTTYVYDAAGNQTKQTDAKGVVRNSTYDALNRLSAVSYTDSALNIAYLYDEASTVTGCTSSNPIGRLTRVVENTVTTVYCYDTRGNITQKRQTQSGQNDVTQYAYTAANRLSSVVSPGNLTTQYARDADGRIVTISVIPPSTALGFGTITVASHITYLPFGPVSSYTLGNGQTVTRSFDANYALTDVVSPALNLHFARDAMGNITALGNASGASPAAETYHYDPLYRLTGVNGPSESPLQTYTYNKTGDRLSKSGGDAANGSYNYTPGTHLLASTATNARTYDANGNTTGSTVGAESFGFSYDGRNRLSVVQRDGATVGTYTYNAFGQRVLKVATLPTAITQRYGYDESSHLIGEYGDGTTARDYIWLGDLPIAVADTHLVGGLSFRFVTTINYVHADDLGTPRVVTDSAGSTIWQWDYQGNPFGEQQPTSINGYTLNLRYPGQYYDVETGTNYNMFRSYEAATGRYLQSDPIGLAAGPSLYAYVGGNPLSGIDPLGLKVGTVGVNGTIGAMWGITGGVGLVFDGSGNVGIYSYGGEGFAYGASLGGGGSFMGSLGADTTTIGDFGGPFGNLNIPYVDGYFDPNNPNHVGAGVSVGPGESFYAGCTNAKVTKIGNINNFDLMKYVAGKIFGGQWPGLPKW